MTTRESILSDPAAVLPAERPGAAALLMTAVVYPLLALWTAVGIGLYPLAFLLWKVLTRWPAGRIMRHFIWLYGRGWMLLMAPFVRFRREGLRDAGIRGPAILVINHLSFFDTYCMALLPFFDVTFAVRSWPFRIPCYAAFMRQAGYLDVESMSWPECLEAGRRVLAGGGFLLFFPEGHRSRDGALQRFYSGAFRLARGTRLPGGAPVHHRHRSPAAARPALAAAGPGTAARPAARRPGRVRQSRRTAAAGQGLDGAAARSDAPGELRSGLAEAAGRPRAGGGRPGPLFPGRQPGEHRFDFLQRPELFSSQRFDDLAVYWR